MTRKPMRNARQPRRCGISFIQDPNNRSISFFKRRLGLFKAASDLNTLTGARVAVVVESETGKMSSFGTPRVDPIIDCFLSGIPLRDEFFDHDETTRVTRLQNRLFKLEKEKYMEEQKAKENAMRRKKIEETSTKAKFVYGDLEDLSVEELHEMMHDLSRILRDIDDHLHNLHSPPPPPQQPMPSYDHHYSHLLPSSSSSLLPSLSQIQLPPPRRLPWASPLNLPRSSWSLPLLSRPQSSLLNPTMHHQPPPPMPRLQQHSSDLLMPQHPFTAQPWPQMTLPTNQAYQNNYNTQQGVHINGGDVSQPFFSQTSSMPALPPPVPPPQPPPQSSSSAQFTFHTDLPPSTSSQQPPAALLAALEAELDPPAEQPAENNAGTQDLTDDLLLANHQWPSPISDNDPYYGFNSYGLDLYMGDLISGYGGQAAADHDIPGPSGLHQQPHGFSDRNLLLESEEEEEDEDEDEDDDDEEEE